MFIAVINQSTLVSNVEVDTMTQAVQKQMILHVAPAWNQLTPKVKFIADQNKIPKYAWVVVILDDSDQAGTLGYHSESNGLVYGVVFARPVLDNGGVVLRDTRHNQNISVASVLSHEVVEMFGDRYANAWVDGPVITQGGEYALELADAVEGDLYDITAYNGTLVSVSNFLFPSWFNDQATADNLPFDYLKKLTKPFAMTSGGYMILRKSGAISQVFGEMMPEWKQTLKKNKKRRKIKDK